MFLLGRAASLAGFLFVLVAISFSAAHRSFSAESDAPNVKEAFAILVDKKLSEEERLKALRSLQKQVSPTLVETLVNILADDSDTVPKLKSTALTMLRMSAFSYYGQAQQDKIDETARRYYEHPNAALREQAVSYGVLRDDQAAYDAIQRDLDKPQQHRLFSDEAAVNYLSTRGESALFNRYIERKDVSEYARALAIQLATSDKGAADKMKKSIALDKSESELVRRAALESLTKVDMASPILWSVVQDKNESPGVRYEAAEALKKSLTKTQNQLLQEQNIK